MTVSTASDAQRTLRHITEESRQFARDRIGVSLGPRIGEERSRIPERQSTRQANPECRARHRGVVVVRWRTAGCSSALVRRNDNRRRRSSLPGVESVSSAYGDCRPRRVRATAGVTETPLRPDSQDTRAGSSGALATCLTDPLSKSNN
jgi:hypothetical protein